MKKINKMAPTPWAPWAPQASSGCRPRSRPPAAPVPFRRSRRSHHPSNLGRWGFQGKSRYGKPWIIPQHLTGSCKFCLQFWGNDVAISCGNFFSYMDAVNVSICFNTIDYQPDNQGCRHFEDAPGACEISQLQGTCSGRPATTGLLMTGRWLNSKKLSHANFHNLRSNRFFYPTWSARKNHSWWLTW